MHGAVAWTVAAMLATVGLASGVPAAPFFGEVIVGEVTWTGPQVRTDVVTISPGSTLSIVDADVGFDTETCPTSRDPTCAPSIYVAAGGRLEVVRSRVYDAGSRYPPELWAEFATVSVADSRFERWGHLYVQFESGRGEFTRSEFVDMRASVAIVRGAGGFYEDNLFLRSQTGAGGAIFIQDGSPHVARNVIESTNGRAMRIQLSTVGEKAWVTAPVVEGNLVRGADVGIFSDSGGGMLVRDNVFRDITQMALSFRVPTSEAYNQHTPPTVVGNRFENVTNGVRAITMARDAPLASTMLVAGNSFAGVQCVAVESAASENAPLHIDARNNWWGSAAGPWEDEACPATFGDVETAPWLLSEV